MDQHQNIPGKGRSDERTRLIRMVLIALFAALSYLALVMFRIPYPAPVGTPFIHLGNMVTILAALLLGGWQGGLSGSLGMGLYDLFFYPSSAFKTLVLKFGIGLFTGLVAGLGRKKDARRARFGLAISAAVAAGVGMVLFAGRLSGMKAFSEIPDVSWIFLLSLGVLLLTAALLSMRLRALDTRILFAALGAAAGIAWNIAGEFAAGTLSQLLAGATVGTAMAASLASLPATLINGAASIVGAVLLYLPIRAALHRAHLDSLIVS